MIMGSSSGVLEISSVTNGMAKMDGECLLSPWYQDEGAQGKAGARF